MVGEAVAVGAAAFAVVFVQLQLWRAAWDAPFTVGGDATFYLMVVRSLGEHGSYLKNPSLGWPFGQTMYDLPQGVDNLHLLVLRVLAVVTGGPGAAVNCFYVLSFVAVAAVAHVVMRLLGIRWWLSGLIALLYAFMPFHFARNEGHLLLSGYQLVPVAVYIALSMFDKDPPLLRWRGPRDFRRGH